MANLLKANFFRIAGGGWSWLAVASLTLLIAMAYLYILNRAVEGKFGTDMYVHINISASDMRESESVHLLFHHTLATFSTLTGVNVWDAATFVLLFYVLMGGIFLYLVMAYYLKSLVAMQWVVMLTMSLMVIAGIHVPQLHTFIYYGVGTPNVIHNPTTIAVKPFAFAAVLLIIYATEHRSTREFFLSVGFTSIAVVLSAYAKPNFVLAFIGAAPLFLGYIAYKYPMPPGRLKWLALPIVSALIVLAVQFMFKFYTPDSTGSGIGFGWITVSGSRGLHPIVGLLLLTAFPLVVLILIPNILRDRLFVFSLILFLVAAFQYLFLHETGTRMDAGNFGWGRQIIVPLLFAASLGYTVKQYSNDRSIFPVWKRIILLSIYSLHIFSGLQYFMQLSTEASYY